MLNKATISLIISLQKKKIREEENLFVIEGDKMVREFLEAGMTARFLIGKPEFINSLTEAHKRNISEIIPANYEELKRMSTLKTPHNVMAVIEKTNIVTDEKKLLSKLTVAMDCIQDPGNLGTIIRAAAWFGIRNIVCSINSVDVYNPKVIQASMGAILNVKVFYTDIPQLLKTATEKGLNIYGAFIKGKSIYTSELSKNGIILLGNESKGLSRELHPYVTHRIMIPGVNKKAPGIDSLNVSMAATVIFSEFARRKK